MSNKKFGGAFVDVLDAQADYAPVPSKTKSMQTVWHVWLKCGHKRLLKNQPGLKARCPVCKPTWRDPARLGQCRVCERRIKIHGRGMCTACDKREVRASAPASDRPEYVQLREDKRLMSEWDELVRSRA